MNTLETSTKQPLVMRFLPILAALSSIAIAAPKLGRPSYWYDEAASMSAATRPLVDLYSLVKSVDIVHGFYYSLLHGWISFWGQHEWATRSLSLVFLAAAAYGFAVLTSRLFSTATSVMATVLFVALPGVTWTGAEARGWSLSVALVVWSFVVLDVSIQSRTRLTRILYTLLVSGSIITCIYAVLLLPAHLYFAGRMRDSNDAYRLVLPSWVIACIVSGPVVLLAVSQRAQVGWISLTPTRIAAKVAIGQLFLGPRDGSDASLVVIGAGVACVVAVLLGLVAVAAGAREDRPATFFGFAWFLVPTFVLAGATALGAHLYQERYLAFAAPGACIVIAQGLSLIRPRFAVTALAVLLVVTIPAQLDQAGAESKSGEGYRRLAFAAGEVDAVVYTAVASRGIGIAYPDPLRHAKDVFLSRSPASSGTLWGINDPSESRLNSLKGRVAVYYRSAKRFVAVPAVSYLLHRGCHQEAKPTKDKRFSVGILDCG